MANVARKGAQSSYATGEARRDFRMSLKNNYFLGSTRKAIEALQEDPYLNCIVKCSKCTAFVWKYNMKYHFEDCHPHEEFENPITEEERAGMNKSKLWI